MNISSLNFLLFVQEKELSTYRPRSLSPFFVKNTEGEISKENKIINKSKRRRGVTNVKKSKPTRPTSQIPEVILTQQEEIDQVNKCWKIIKKTKLSNFLLLMLSKIGLRRKNVLIGMA